VTLPSHIPAEVYAAYVREQRARPGLGLENFLAERAPGLLPPEPRPLAECAGPTIPSGSKGQLVAERDVGQRGAPGRTEHRVTGSRHNAIRVHRPDLGVTFRSLTEERRHDHLVARQDVVHLDYEPLFRMPSGNTYRADFLVWTCACTCCHKPACGVCAKGDHYPVAEWVEDVKAPGKLGTAFLRARREFDAWHPLAPLRVISWDAKEAEWIDR